MLSAGQLGAATVLLALALPFFGSQTITWRADAVLSVAILGALGTGAATNRLDLRDGVRFGPRRRGLDRMGSRQRCSLRMT